MLKIEDAASDNFKDVPSPCRYCLYWQTSGAYGEEMLKPEMEQQKREWFNKVASEFGTCIKIAYLADTPIGFIQYAPAKFFPRTKEYVAGPPSKDAVFLACLYIASKETRRKGLGTIMLRNLLAQLKQSGFKTVETFAKKGSAENPSGPLELYLKHNFKIKSEKDDFPLMRLEL
ncbi:GNAT family N-acetyltransferase [Candidatus Bathyarchaeota archaeon]|nr:GNAT family N-acetyltransferase [Candidatus Bathyarchaeota archaeon]